MVRRFAWLVVGMMILALALAFPDAHAQDDVVELTWLQWWVNEWGPDVHADLIKTFEERNPGIKINVVDVPWSEMASRLRADAVGGGTYDFFGTEIDWVSGNVRLGYMENLTPWLEADPEFANLLTESTPIVYEGDVRMLCLYMIPYHFAYNTALFAERGLEAPRSWDEFAAVMEELYDPLSGRYGTALPLQDASFILTRLFGFKLAQMGGRWLDDNGNAAFNSPEGVAALQWWVDFYNRGLVVPGAFGETQMGMREYLASGQIGGVIDGPFVQTIARQVNPDIQLAYAPPWRAETGGYMWSCSGVGINANSPHKKEAWEFLRYLYSEEVAVRMTHTVSLLWATKAAVASLEGADDPILRYVPDFMGQDPKHNLMKPALPSGDVLTSALGLAFQEALAGLKDPKTALDEAAAVWQREIDAAR